VSARPRQVALVSGKGGTGKTSLAVSLALLARPVVAADCDVDTANLGLLLPGLEGTHEPLFTGKRASIDLRLCRGCGTCEGACRFEAIRVRPETGRAFLELFFCEGCGVCARVCPNGALELYDQEAGFLTVRRSEVGPLIHASLGYAQENSGELVTRVREAALEAARARGLDLVLLDGPPGLGLPVQAALAGVDLALAVTEPSVAGEHDLARLLELTARLGVPTAVVLNKADLCSEVAERIAAAAERAGAHLAGEIPFDSAVPLALARGEPPLVVPAVAESVGRLLARVRERLGG
jgi:MinD superfamily P-loop ATPase